MVRMSILSTSPATPGSAPWARGTPACSRPQRIGLWCDDHMAAAPWWEALSDEGLTVVSQEHAEAARVDAQVLWIGTGLAAQLPVLRERRAATPLLPLLVACRGLRELDQILALEMGADDVVDVRLGAPVVAARLRALCRRQAQRAGIDPGSPQELQFGALRLLGRERRVLLGEQVVPLSEGEFEVLWLLASQAGRTISRREILQRVRGLDDHPTDRSIDSRVYRIRAKLGDPATAAQRIRTVRHHGYAFSQAPW